MSDGLCAGSGIEGGRFDHNGMTGITCQVCAKDLRPSWREPQNVVPKHFPPKADRRAVSEPEITDEMVEAGWDEYPNEAIVRSVLTAALSRSPLLAENEKLRELRDAVSIWYKADTDWGKAVVDVPPAYALDAVRLAFENVAAPTQGENK